MALVSNLLFYIETSRKHEKAVKAATSDLIEA
jgi:hypothetical protein